MDNRKNYVIRGNKLHKPSLPPIASNRDDDKSLVEFENILKGHFNIKDLSDPQMREVRIFLSSTFSDFKVERNVFIRKVIPELRHICTSNGLDLRLCDMRWGVTDSAVNEHQVEKLCSKEIELCRKNSVGPFFVLFVGNRYGYQPVPSEMKSSEFELFMTIISNNYPKEIDNFKKWYVKDDNAIPETYVLLPIRTYIPGYADFSDEERRRVSGHEWWKVEESIRKTLKRASKIACESGQIDVERKRELTRSVTETELLTAVQNQSPDVSSRCLAYERQLIGLMENLQSDAAKNYIDYMLRDDETVSRNECLESLEEMRKLIKSLNLSRFRQYRVPWFHSGISEELTAHREYLDKLTRSIVGDLKNLITVKLRSSEKINNKLDRYMRNLQSEVIHHWLFAQQRVDIFCGRDTQLGTIFQLMSPDYRHPIVIYGNTGCGKTALIAAVAQRIQTSILSAAAAAPSSSTPTHKINSDNININTEPKYDQLATIIGNGKSPIVILRFLGTSAASTSLYQVLYSLCLQIQLVYRMKVVYRKMTSLSNITVLFKQLLHIVSRRYASQMPLILILDSLDQLLSQYNLKKRNKTIGSQFISWLPIQLPPGIFLLISLATDAPSIPLFDAVATRLGGCRDKFVEIADLGLSEIRSIIDEKSRCRKRRLTSSQMELVMSYLQRNPQALYINIILDQSLRWTSFMSESDLVLADTTNSAIQMMFSQLEHRYGPILIRYTLGYLTLSLVGLSEVEIEDLLSLQDSVLNEVYQYHDPPIKGVIRVPSLLWARIHSDLAPYVVEKRTDGKITLSWYHRQIQQCAMDRYINEPMTHNQLHIEMAEYYLLTGNCLKSIVLSNAKRTLNIEDANRLICKPPISAQQPRRLHAIVYHLTQRADSDLLVKHCIASAEFLIAYMGCFGIHDLMALLKSCHETFPQNDVITIIKNCVVFIESWIDSDPNQFAIQLLGYLNRLELITLPSQLNEKNQSCFQILQQFSHKLIATLNNTNCLIPSIACFPSCLGSMKLYKENVESVEVMPWNPQLIILVELWNHEWTVRLFDTNDQITICQIKMENKPINVFIPSSNQDIIVIQDDRFISIYDTDSGQFEAKHGLLINNKIMLNECAAVEQFGVWIAIAAQNRIAILEHRIINSDKYPITYRNILTAREVDKTVRMCFLETNRHKVLVSGHTYHSKSSKMFIIKLWQFEQSNELWSMELMNLSSKFTDCLYIWPVLLREGDNSCKTSSPMPSGEMDYNENNGGVLLVLPNGNCFHITNILDQKSIINLSCGDCNSQNSERIRSFVSDNDAATLTVVSNINRLNKAKVYTINNTLSQINQLQLVNIHERISTAAYQSETDLIYVGTRNGSVFIQQNNKSNNNNSNNRGSYWNAHRAPINLIIVPHPVQPGISLMKISTFSSYEKVFKCWMKSTEPSDDSSETYADTICETAASVSITENGETFVVLSNDLSTIYHISLVSEVNSFREFQLSPPMKSSTQISENETNLEILGLHLILDNCGILILTNTNAFIYNLETGQLWSSLNSNSTTAEPTIPNQSNAYWFSYNAKVSPTTLYVLSFQSKTGYFIINGHNLPNLSNIRLTKRFLPPVGVNRPHSQLCEITQMRTLPEQTGGGKLFLMFTFQVSTRNNSITTLYKDLSSSMFIATINLSDPISTPNLVVCQNLDDTKKIPTKNSFAKNNNQPVYSTAILPPIEWDNCNNIYDMVNCRGPAILVGGFGEIYVWDLITGSCRLQKVPNFHTWFKHSTTIHLQNCNPMIASISSVGVTPNNCNNNKNSKRSSIASNVSNSKGSSLPFQMNPITALYITPPSGATVISGCSTGYIIVWNWLEVMKLNGAEPDPPSKFRFILNTKHSSQVTCLCANADCSLVASGSNNMELYLSSVSQNQCLHQIRTHCYPTSLTFIDNYTQTNDNSNESNQQSKTKSKLICEATHIGQKRLLIFDVF